VRATASPSDASTAADIQTEFQAAEQLFSHMQQAAAAVIAISSGDSDATAAAADCQQLVDSSRAFASACARAEQLATFLEDKVAAAARTPSFVISRAGPLHRTQRGW
jgi:hypothetical protein